MSRCIVQFILYMYLNPMGNQVSLVPREPQPVDADQHLEDKLLQAYHVSIWHYWNWLKTDKWLKLPSHIRAHVHTDMILSSAFTQQLKQQCKYSDFLHFAFSIGTLMCNILHQKDINLCRFPHYKFCVYHTPMNGRLTSFVYITYPSKHTVEIFPSVWCQSVYLNISGVNIFKPLLASTDPTVFFRFQPNYMTSMIIIGEDELLHICYLLVPFCYLPNIIILWHFEI